MKLQNLFFKLNVEKPEYKDVYDFFNLEAEKLNISKIELLKRLIALYRYVGHIGLKITDIDEEKEDLKSIIRGELK